MTHADPMTDAINDMASADPMTVCRSHGRRRLCDLRRSYVRAYAGSMARGDSTICADRFLGSCRPHDLRRSVPRPALIP